MDTRALAVRINERCRLTGTFTLRSGQISDFYFDKYQFESDPELLKQVAARAAPLIAEDVEVLAGLELGGVPLATALSLETGLQSVYVRKAAKPYGTAKLAEGCDVAGRRLLIVEDVITTGGQVAESASQLRELGAVVHQVLCVIDRSHGDHSQLDAAGLEVTALFTDAYLSEASSL